VELRHRLHPDLEARAVITLIVPTRNRAHTLKIVAPSYFAQDEVSELIFVIDAGEDNSRAVLTEIAQQHPEKRLRVLTNERRLGASQSRNVGIAASTNELILFCDDDEYLEAGYARVLSRKLRELNAGAVSGRRIYLRTGESKAAALERFGSGLRPGKPFRPLLCEYVNGAKFARDLALPITNAVILTKKNLLLAFPFDGHYARGNGYREESDFQMNLFVNGFDIYVTNECHSFHLPLSQVRTGGQRTRPLLRLYWSVYYTRYFFAKYYARYARRLGLRSPRWLALAAFALFATYRETLRPGLHGAAMWALARRRPPIEAGA
jgi:glycosyltransferase involved in cell wall biosynthesis